MYGAASKGRTLLYYCSSQKNYISIRVLDPPNKDSVETQEGSTPMEISHPPLEGHDRCEKTPILMQEDPTIGIVTHASSCENFQRFFVYIRKKTGMSDLRELVTRLDVICAEMEDMRLQEKANVEELARIKAAYTAKLQEATDLLSQLHRHREQCVAELLWQLGKDIRRAWIADGSIGPLVRNLQPVEKIVEDDRGSVVGRSIGVSQDFEERRDDGGDGGSLVEHNTVGENDDMEELDEDGGDGGDVEEGNGDANEEIKEG
uniref:Uncharacterized protein n=1 Tax=Chenopodium quinoa TaxID=63459 RepID=A0A803NAV4_CHEQI